MGKAGERLPRICLFLAAAIIFALNVRAPLGFGRRTVWHALYQSILVRIG
jgi:hypothetical protein